MISSKLYGNKLTEQVLVLKLIYLAPEIPALSATFVYNELLAVEALGHDVTSVSVHKPHALATDARLVALKGKTHYLYACSRFWLFKQHLKLLLSSPHRYLKTLTMCLTDMWDVGLFSRNAVGLLYRFFYAAGLSGIAKSTGAKHIHVHFAHVPTDIAMYAASMADISFSVMAHANDIFERGLLIDEKVKRAKFFATISEFNRKYLKSRFNVNPDKLEIIRCGVDDSVFTPKTESDFVAPIHIGVVGRLVEKKGIDTLIRAIAVLVGGGHSYKLSVAGSGPLQEELEQIVAELGVESNVTFVGALPHDQVVSFVSGLDIFILPCKQDKNGDMDGIPVVLMEAMMVGTPVLSSKLSGIPELVIDGETGLLIEPDNVQQLVEAIGRLVTDRQLRSELVEQAMHKVRNEFAQNVNAKRLEALFNSPITNT